MKKEKKHGQKLSDLVKTRKLNEISTFDSFSGENTDFSSLIKKIFLEGKDCSKESKYTLNIHFLNPVHSKYKPRSDQENRESRFPPEYSETFDSY